MLVNQKTKKKCGFLCGSQRKKLTAGTAAERRQNMDKQRRNFCDAFRLYCSGMTAEQRSETLKSIAEQRKTADAAQAQILDGLQADLRKVWDENPQC